MASPIRAKCYGIAAAFIGVACLGGCAGIERFAPPGIVRYENLSGDKPQNPEIKARVTERKAGRDAKFPNLSLAPQKTPPTMPAEEQENWKRSLSAAREDLAAAIAEDRIEAAADRAEPIVLPGGVTTPLEGAANALSAATDKDDAAARAERGLPPRVKPAKN
jgi:hypothetical protein